MRAFTRMALWLALLLVSPGLQEAQAAESAQPLYGTTDGNLLLPIQGEQQPQIVLSDATDCPANVTTARAGNFCRDLDDGKLWVCNTPTLGGNTTLCDQAAEWADALLPVTLQGAFANPTGNTITSAVCGTREARTGTTASYLSVCDDPTFGPTISARVGASAPGLTLDPEGTNDLVLKTAGVTRLLMSGTTGRMTVNPSSYLQLRQGTGVPTSADCNETGEAGSTYLQMDASDACKLWVCTGTTGWKNQCGLQTACYKNPQTAAADDNQIFASPGKAFTVLLAWCHYQNPTTPPTTPAQFSLVGMTTPGAITCAGPTAAATPQAITTGGAVAAFTPFRFSVTNNPVPDATDTYELCVGY